YAANNQANPATSATKSSINKTVLRLLAAISLYTRNYSSSLVHYLEADFCGLGDSSHLCLLDLKKLALLEAKHASRGVVWHRLDLDVQITHRCVIETASSLNLVFSIYHLVLELFEILISLQVMVCFSNGKQDLQRTGQHVLGISRFLHALSVDDSCTRL